MHKHVYATMLRCTDQRTTYGDFFPSNLWVPGIKPRSSGWLASGFTCWVNSLTLRMLMLQGPLYLPGGQTPKFTAKRINDFFRSHLLTISWSKSPHLILLLCHFYDPFKTSELLRVNLKDVKATVMVSTVEKLHESFLCFPWSLKFGGKLFKIHRPKS